MAPLYPYQATIPMSHPYEFRMPVPGASLSSYNNEIQQFFEGFILGALLWLALLIAFYCTKLGFWITTTVLDVALTNSGERPCHCSVCTSLYSEGMTEDALSTGNANNSDLFLMD